MKKTNLAKNHPAVRQRDSESAGGSERGEQYGAFSQRHVVTVLLLAAVLFVTRFLLFRERLFDPDELEHIHAAWLVAQGKVPYLDFFEHHTPWLYYIVAPWFAAFDAETNPESAIAFLHFTRVLSLLCSGVALGLLVWAGRSYNNLPGGILAAFLATCTPLFLRKTLEFRPDVPALALWVACLGLFFRGIKFEDAAWRSSLPLFFSAGFCLGAAIMFTQKMLFVLPGLGVALGVWWWWATPAAAKAHRFGSCALFGAGIAVPALLTWLAFAWAGAGHEFIEKNFLLNAAWKVRVPPLGKLIAFFKETWPVVFLAVGGCLMGWPRSRAATSLQWVGVLTGLTLAGLVAGLWIIPVAQEQYYLMAVPLLALLGAEYFLKHAAGLREKIRSPVLYVSLVALCLIPALDFRVQLKHRNDQQLRNLRFVLEQAAPGELVMDGWRGLGVFRPHAFYYYFLHREIRAMLPRKDLDSFLADLEAGLIQPKVIVMDQDLEKLSPRFTRFVHERYTLDKAKNIYIRKPDG